MQRIVLILGLVFVVGLLVLIGTRLSDEAISILAAVVISLGAGACVTVPVTVILVWALVRRTQGSVQTPTVGRDNQYPPVIVVGPGAQGLPPGYGPPPYHSLPAPSRQRDFRIVGSDVVDAEWTE